MRRALAWPHHARRRSVRAPRSGTCCIVASGPMSRPAYSPLTASDFDSAFPGSRKVLVKGPAGVQVPVREIALTNGTTLQVYDTSGPRHVDVQVGLPAIRERWIRSRQVEPVRQGTRRQVLRAANGTAVTQLQYARKGEVTPEM